MDKVFLQYVFLHVSPNHHNLKKILYAIHMLQLYVFSGVSSNYSLLKKILYTDCMFTVFRRYVFSGVGLKFHLLKKILNTDYIGMVSLLNVFSDVKSNFRFLKKILSTKCISVLMLLQILFLKNKFYHYCIDKVFLYYVLLHVFSNCYFLKIFFTLTALVRLFSCMFS